jgi:hypothetical protein
MDADQKGYPIKALYQMTGEFKTSDRASKRQDDEAEKFADSS